MTSLNRLRTTVFEMGDPGTVDEDYIDNFTEQVNNDLNMPRALAVTWDLIRSDLSNSTKKATLEMFDRVLGLNLTGWKPQEEVVAEDITRLLEKRQKARVRKNWAEADAIREQINAAGYQIKDTSEGPQLKRIKQKIEN
jgi:cysteinyl-tRNA synthetase